MSRVEIITSRGTRRGGPFSGQIFAFRGKRGDLLKLLVWDGRGFLLVAKRLERSRFAWPSPAAERVRLAGLAPY